MLDHGPLVKTQDAGEVYKSKKGLVALRNIQWSYNYEALCKYLNISHVYLFGRAYVIHNTPGSNIDAVVQSLKAAVDKAHMW